MKASITSMEDPVVRPGKQQKRLVANMVSIANSTSRWIGASKGPTECGRQSWKILHDRFSLFSTRAFKSPIFIKVTEYAEPCISTFSVRTLEPGADYPEGYREKPGKPSTALSHVPHAITELLRIFRRRMLLSTRAARCAALMAEPDELYPERILYPRNTRALPKTSVVGGQPIEEETCMALRTLVFGSCATPPKAEWARTGLTLRPYGQSLAFGLRAPRNTTRGLVTAVQAVMLKHFLFKCDRQEFRTGPEALLKPSYDRQIEVLTSAIAEIIWRCAGGFSMSTCPNVVSNTVPKAVVVLPQETAYIQHSVQYFQDGLTETLHLFEFNSLEDLEIFVKRYLYLFHDEGGPGAKLLLYSAVLSRSLSKVRNDLEDAKASILGGCTEEGPISIVVFVLTGRASPHLHNGVVHVGDENTYAVPQWGVLIRSEVGFLVYEGDGDVSKQLGSRLKTPSLPIWVTLCLGHHGVLFNTNRELLRNYHAERRFEVQYFTCGGSHATLTVDTRANETSGTSDTATMETADIAATPLEKLIRSKWQDALIQWNGTPVM